MSYQPQAPQAILARHPIGNVCNRLSRGARPNLPPNVRADVPGLRLCRRECQPQVFGSGRMGWPVG